MVEQTARPSSKEYLGARQEGEFTGLKYYDQGWVIGFRQPPSNKEAGVREIEIGGIARGEQEIRLFLATPINNFSEVKLNRTGIQRG